MLRNLSLVLVVLALLGLPLASVADDKTGAKLFSGGELRGFEKSLVPKMDQTKGGNQILLTTKTHGALVFHREGSGEPEIHTKLADFMIVLSGEGQIQVGGNLTEGKTTAPDEIRGKTLEGGTMYKIAQGDVLYVPANVPHRTHVAAGKQLNVMVIKAQ